MNIFKSTPTTVAGVLAVFQTAITDLETVANAQRALADKQAAVAAQALAEQEVAMAEATRATVVAAQMKAIFN